MYHIEIYNRTTQKVITSKTAPSESEASQTARAFISRIKESFNVVKESVYDTSPRGYVFGQTLYTADAIYDISTGKA